MKIKCLKIIILLQLLGIELLAQSPLIDSSFQPFFNLPNRYPSIDKAWEFPKNGKLFLIGSFKFWTPGTTGNIRHGGLTLINRNGSLNSTFKGGGFGNSVSDISPINDTTFYIKDNSYKLIDSTGSGKNQAQWRINVTNTIKCFPSAIPFFYEDGSSLMSNTKGNPVGNFNACSIIIPPDTFPHRYIIKLDPLGNWDSSFTADANAPLLEFKAYDSNRIMVIGQVRRFTHYVGRQVDGLCRIYHDGRLDTTFKSPLLSLPNLGGSFTVTEKDDDGKFFLYGDFFVKGDTMNTHSLVRLHADGSIDSSFKNFDGAKDSAGLYKLVSTIVSTADGGYLVGGRFNQYQGYPVNNIVKIDSNGVIDPNYFSGRGPDNSDPSVLTQISFILPSKLGGIYVMGNFDLWDSIPTQPIVRLIDKTVGLNDELFTNQNHFTIYPNPAKEELLIETENILPIQQIELYDLSGRRQQIWEGKSGENKYRLSLENLQTGLYFIVLKFKNGERLTKKIVKQ